MEVGDCRIKDAVLAIFYCGLQSVQILPHHVSAAKIHIFYKRRHYLPQNILAARVRIYDSSATCPFFKDMVTAGVSTHSVTPRSRRRRGSLAGGSATAAQKEILTSRSLTAPQNDKAAKSSSQVYPNQILHCALLCSE